LHAAFHADGTINALDDASDRTQQRQEDTGFGVLLFFDFDPASKCRLAMMRGFWMSKGTAG
tara:strand:+ start:284 stop:466 length:183 start_codon:yes stop_codon:yes gene_type:complete